MLVLVVTLSLVSGGLSSILCPTKFDSDQTVHLPHPTSCSKFLTCVGSHPVEQDCPAELHWNEETSLCDYPRAARCSRGNDSDQLEPSSFNAAAVASSVCLPQTYRCPINPNPAEQVVFLKHRDCRKFYACVSTHPVELSCPPTLYWNSRSCACDYELEAECDGIDRIFEEAPEEADEEVNSKPEEDVPEEADTEQVVEVEPSENYSEEPEVNYDALPSEVVRKRRAADGSESSGGSSANSNNDTSTGGGSGSTGPIQSGADIRAFSSIVMIVATVVMSTF